MPIPLDQGSLGSCGANAMANALSFVNGKEGQPTFHPSRLALYYECRVFVEHQSPDVDSGVTIADMCRAVEAFHACPEEDWPYDISKFMLPPPEKAMLDALQHAKFKAVSVPQRLSSIKSMLAAGFPIVFGIQVFKSFESRAVAETGIVPLPDITREACIGGHALCLMGFDDAKQAFLVLTTLPPQKDTVEIFALMAPVSPATTDPGSPSSCKQRGDPRISFSSFPIWTISVHVRLVTVVGGMRSQAIRDLMFRLLDRGKGKPEIADILGVKRNTIYRWIRAGRGRMPPRGPRYGKRKLSVAQEQAVVARVRSSPSTTLRCLAHYIHDTVSIPVAVSTVALILKRAHFSHKKAVKRNTEYDIQKGSLFLQQVRPLLCPTLASIDEASFHLNSAPRYAWALRGHRAVVTRPMVRGT